MKLTNEYNINCLNSSQEIINQIISASFLKYFSWYCEWNKDNSNDNNIKN